MRSGSAWRCGGSRGSGPAAGGTPAAGAAEQLKDALLVNPYDTHGTAETIQQALQMPLEERQRRHQRLLENIRTYDVHWWRRSFLQALAETSPD